MITTHILVDGDSAYMIASDFSDFTYKLSSFATYCHAKDGNIKSDYIEEFKGLKEALKSLIRDRDISEWTTETIFALFKKIDKILKSKTVNNANLETIYELILNFIDDEILIESPQGFKHNFLEEAISANAKEYYSEGLFNAVCNSLEAEIYDAAVFDAFKFLDESLRKLAGIDSHQIYGEELINKIFSPNSGILQMKTHPNEQIGLRNWFSGANAVFRNPLAHRFVNLDQESAYSTIVMITLMIKIARELSEDDNNTINRA